MEASASDLMCVISVFMMCLSIQKASSLSPRGPQLFHDFLGLYCKCKLWPVYWAHKRGTGAVKSLICTSYNPHKSPLYPPPPLFTSHTIPRSTELSIWGTSGLLWQHMVIHSRCLKTVVSNIFPINNRARSLFTPSEIARLYTPVYTDQPQH